MTITRCKRTLLCLIVISLAMGMVTRPALAAESKRFLVSYGGTAGYQLPLMGQ